MKKENKKDSMTDLFSLPNKWFRNLVKVLSNRHHIKPLEYPDSAGDTSNYGNRMLSIITRLQQLIRSM